MSTKTVNLSSLPQTAPTKLLSQVRAGKMSMFQYHQELAKKNVTANWQGKTFVVNTGGGLTDPSGDWLTTEEYIEVFKSLIPSPLKLAGKRLDIMGPTMGAAVAIVTRAWYATQIRLGTVDRNTGLVTSWQDIVPIETYRVKLRNPDTNERETRREGNQAWYKTSQLKYKRFTRKASFDYHGELKIRFETNSPWHPGKVIAQVEDRHHNFAWIYDLTVLEDV